jgi:hypothetical protein
VDNAGLASLRQDGGRIGSFEEFKKTPTVYKMTRIANLSDMTKEHTSLISLEIGAFIHLIS